MSIFHILMCCPHWLQWGQWLPTSLAVWKYLSTLLKLWKSFVLYHIKWRTKISSSQGMCTMISTFRGVRTRLELKIPSRLCLERNNEFLTCSNPSQCGISLSTSLLVSLLLSVTTYDTTKNHEFSIAKMLLWDFYLSCQFKRKWKISDMNKIQVIEE